MRLLDAVSTVIAPAKALRGSRVFSRPLLAAFISVATLCACQQAAEERAPAAAPEQQPSEALLSADNALTAVLDAQDDEARARYQYRNPKETLEFFGIEPGMTVVEGLPGRGWYTRILAPYLGTEGCLIGANYPMDIWPLFPFGTEAFITKMSTWTTDFPNDARGWGGDKAPDIKAFYFGSMPADLAGSADVVFFARVLHNLARFQNEGKRDYLTETLADAYRVLKPGGVFGVVQHQARDQMSDEFADGSHGYLKKAWLIEQIENAGFEFVADSDINANPNDVPGEEDIVWRLPPNYRGTDKDPELKAAVDAIGESNRMTLKFIKPE